MPKTKKASPPKRGEQAIADTDAKFHIMAEGAASGIFILQGTHFRYVNLAAEHLTGYSRKELLAMNYTNLVPAGLASTLRRLNTRLQRGDIQSSREEFKLVTKQGEERWIDLTSGPIEYNGRPAVMGTASDVTERKRAELLQDAVYRIAQATDRSKGLDDLLPALHAIISEVVTARNFYIALYDKEKDLISFPYYVDEYDHPVGSIKPEKGLTDYILRTGKSLLCDLETHRMLEEKGEIKLLGTPSQIWLGVPLIDDGEVIGAVVVQSYDDPAAYGEREQRILEFVSSQVAMAIDRKRVEDALRENEVRIQRRADEMSALFETTRELATQHDIPVLLQTIVDRAASLLRSPAGNILLFNPERKDLELVVAHGEKSLVGSRVMIGEGVSGQVAQSLKPLVVNDYRKWKQHSKKFSTETISAMVAVPMQYSGELLGVVTLFEPIESNGNSTRTYSQEDVNLLAFFASAAASAVHNARIFDETQDRLVELELLYQASLAGAHIRNRQAAAQRIIDALATQFDWIASIWVVDLEERGPVLLALHDKSLTGDALAGEFDRLNNLEPTQGIVVRVCKTGRPIRAGDVSQNPYYVQAYPGTRSELCVPLKVGGKTIGCINVESVELDAFNAHDERILTTLANQAALAIENAHLFDETRRRSLRQAALNTIITAATRVGTDIDTVLDTVLEETLKALDLQMGVIWLNSSPRAVQRVAARGISTPVSFIFANAAFSGELSLDQDVVVDDWSQQVTHPLSSTLHSTEIHSSIIVPLATESRRIGGLTVASSQIHHWTAEEISLVETIGREVGAAAERARLFDETRARLTELEAVNRVSITLRLSQSIEEMLPNLIDETLRALEAETGGIWLYDYDRDKLRQVIGRGWCTNLASIDLGPGEGVPGAVFTIGDIYFSSDLNKDVRTSPEMRASIPVGWSAVCVPIRSEQETIGVLLVSLKLPREFDGEDARLLVTLTEMAGNAIHRMRLNQQTERHAAELEGRVAERTAELQQALQKAQAADRLKSEFIANVNHELRTPLTNLVLYYQMLRAQPTVKTEERLNVIGRELQRLRNLIEDLLNLSRLDLGQVTLHLMPHDLNSLVQTLVEDRRSLAEERGLTLIPELSPDLPPVWLDEPMIVQAVSNLLTNALNYTPSGGRVWVRTMTEQTGEQPWVGFSVQDTGLGINDEEIPRLFERFYRGKAGHESAAPGTGLGLAIVKQVVEQHHGRIEVAHGEGGQGAVFAIWLPIQKEPATS
ncbi:MAG: GAF domain-containing protein [Anaerolineales bacterium]